MFKSYSSSFVEFLGSSVGRDFSAPNSEMVPVRFWICLNLTALMRLLEVKMLRISMHHFHLLLSAWVPSQGKGFPTDGPEIKK